MRRFAAIYSLWVMILKKKSSWSFYSIKILKQILVEGQPDPNLVQKLAKDLDSTVDELLEDDGQSFEESIMLIHAQSYAHANKIAEKKALESERNGTGLNAYGQKVTWKFIKIIDCYWIIDDLATGAEIYSCFHDTDKSVTADEFINKWFNETDS